MKPITIRLQNINISDIYCYVGVVIFTTYTGEVYSLPLITIYSELKDKYKEFDGFLKIALINNDWISNDQFKAIVQQKIQKTFNREWSKASKNIFEYRVNFNNCQKIGITTGVPIYDIKAYAHHIFIAHGKGLDVIKINDDTSTRLNVQSCNKKFDQRILSISAKIGEVLVSAGKEGLFSGSLWDKEFKIKDEAIEKESFKTLWSNYNFNNYTDEITFEHIVNDVTDEKERKFFYSRQDEDGKKKRISKIATQKISSEVLISNKIDNLYVINSNAKFFLFKNDGKIIAQNLITDTNSNSHFSASYKTIYNKFKSKVLEAKTAKFSLVIETFDGLHFLDSSNLIRLSSVPPLNFRTYLSSIRLRNTISATYKDYSEIYLHSDSVYQKTVE